jgi:pSer/pThr/pTyr-binding forkhead associated (FHA) protein
MSGLVVDVVFRDRVLETVPFDRPTLRVGRMPENDLVIDNLAVSRFHARLHLEDRRVFLEDAGSENGCLVNDERVAGRREIAPGDRIQIGKHELRVRSAAADDGAGRRAGRRKSDGFDGGRTYLVGMQPAPSHAPASADAPAPPVAPTAQPKEEIPMIEKRSAPVSVPVGVVASPSSPEAGGVAPGPPGHELDFDFVGTLGDEPERSAAASPPPTPVRESVAAAAAVPPSPAPMHAGFIVQHQGKLERVVAWQKDQLVAGRAADCDVLLGVDEVSRRHARFERVGNRFEVCDLGSVNGTFVNGRRVERQALQVGDVVQIEGFKLTFVLDRQPIDEMVAPPAPPAAAEQKDDTFAMTMLQEQMPHRPGFTEVLAKPGPGEVRAPANEAEVEAVALPEGDLFTDELDEVVPIAEEVEKLEAPVAVPLRGSSRATSLQDLGRVSAPKLGEREVVFELRVRVELLPPALREAFEAAGASELVLPAELRLKS